MIRPKTVWKFLPAVLLFVLCATEGHAQAPAAPAPCPNGYTFAFFNGVANTFQDALDSLELLRKMGFDKGVDVPAELYNHEDVRFEPFYNHTGSTVGSSALQDVAEVFNQRALELDDTGSWSGKHFYMFWDQVDALVGTPGYAHSMSNADAGFDAFYKKFETGAINITLDSLAAWFSPPTLLDYAQHKAQLDADVASGRKLVMVAHSQGNLFVNPAYDYVQPQIGSNLVKVVHIAPASPKLHGDWELADIDLIINGLRLRNGFATVPDVNLYLQSFNNDPSGHTLAGTYLDPTRAGLAMTQALIAAAFGAISQGQCAMSVTPANQQAKADDTIGLTAKLINPVLNPNAIVSYQWQVSGNANGTLKDPVSGNINPSLQTSSPSVTYIASSNAVQGLLDTVTVRSFVENALDSTVPATRKEIANATSIIAYGTAIQVTPIDPTLALGEIKTFSVLVAPAPPTGGSYRWTLTGDGSIGSNGIVTTTTNSIVYTAPNSAGSATLFVEVLDATGATVASTTVNIKIGDSNGCFDKVSSISNPGSTYSLTLQDVESGVTGTVQMDYAWKGSVPFADPPYTNSAYEYDVTTTFTYPPPYSTMNSSNKLATYGSAAQDASYLIYGSAETSTSPSGSTSQNSVTLSPPLPFGKITQLIPGGAPVTLVYSGIGTSGGGTGAGTYSDVWQLTGTPNFPTGAGTFKTCVFQVTSSLSPTKLDTKWMLYGYGIVVHETVETTSSGTTSTDTRDATALSFNGVPYTGP